MPKIGSVIIQIRTYISQLKDIHAQPSFDDVRINAMAQLATERLLLNISEATRRIPETEKSKTPSVPWDEIAGIGNILRHDYDDVNIEIVQKIISEGHLDQLIGALDQLNPDAEQARRVHPRPSSENP